VAAQNGRTQNGRTQNKRRSEGSGSKTQSRSTRSQPTKTSTKTSTTSSTGSSTRSASSRPTKSAAATTAEAAEVIRLEEESGNSIGEQEAPFHRPPWPRAFSFGLITGALFLFSWVGQFIFQMITARNDAEEHGQPFQWSEFFPQFFSSTLENWQSEFLQLVWQAAGLALFYFWGSSQSKEGDERLEAKIDLLLRDRGIDPSKL
jgi:hypothetical protein